MEKTGGEGWGDCGSVVFVLDMLSLGLTFKRMCFVRKAIGCVNLELRGGQG